jgi:hypothetical protein
MALDIDGRRGSLLLLVDWRIWFGVGEMGVRKGEVGIVGIVDSFHTIYH